MATTADVTNYISNTTYEQTGNVVVVTANTGYKFAEAPVASGYNTWGSSMEQTGVLSADNKTATFDFTDWDTADIEGNVVTAPQPIILDLFPTLTNCTATGIPEDSFDSDTVLDIVVTANTGFKFEDAPKISYYDTWGKEQYAQFTVSEDGKTATFNEAMSNYPLSSGISDMYLYLTAEAVVQSSYGSRYGCVNIYRVTDQQLTDFCKKRFVYMVGENDRLVRYDLGEFVNRIRRVFCDVGNTVPTTICCANTDTEVGAEAMQEDTQTLDFGTVLLPFHNEDNTDFNSRVQVFLPFVGLVDLNSAYVGKEIGLKYEINVVTGDGVAMLTYNDTAFATYDCKPSTELMFKTNSMSVATIGGDEFTAKFLLGLRPYVLMQWNASHNENLLNADCLRTTIGNCSGVVKFADVAGLHSGQMTTDERTRIEQLLAQGVFVQND